MKPLGVISVIIIFGGCQSDQTGPRPQPIPATSARAYASEESPPSGFPFGSDTYAYSGPFVGSPLPPLACQLGTTAGATYDGYLVAEADQTSLDARLEIPAGTG